MRLTPASHAIGLASSERVRRVERKRQFADELVHSLQAESVTPEVANEVLVPRGTSPLKQKARLYDLRARPQVNYVDIESLSPTLLDASGTFGDLHAEVVEQVEINLKYDGYLDKERELAENLTRLDGVPLDLGTDYARLTSLSMEARQKLDKVRPTTLGQASRISGVSPADLSVLLVYLGR